MVATKPRVEGLQLPKVGALLDGKRGQIFHVFRHAHFTAFKRRVHVLRGELEPKLVGLFHDFPQRQQTVDVPGRFGVEVKVPVIVHVLGGQGFGHPRHAHVVRSRRQHPTAQLLVGLLEVPTCGAGGQFHVVALVDRGRHFQPVFGPRPLHELPKTGGTRRAHDLAQPAFDDGEVFEIRRHPFLLQDGLDHGEPPCRALQVQHGGAVPVRVHNQLAVQRFHHPKPIQRHRLSEQRQIVGHRGRNHRGMLLGSHFKIRDLAGV